VSGGWRLGDRLGCEPRSVVLVGCGELRSRILPRLEFFSGANWRTAFLIDRGDAPEPLSLHAQRKRRKKGTRKALTLRANLKRTPRPGAPQALAILAKPARAASCRPTPRRGARLRQGHTGTGESKQNAPQTPERPNLLVRNTSLPDSPCFDVRSPLIACLANVRLSGDGRQDAGQAALRRTRMAAGPVQACVREVARQGQVISVASPRLNEVAPFESRTKYTPRLSNYLMTAPSLSNWQPTPMFPLDIHF
jgi:hypothetical protein